MFNKYYQTKKDKWKSISGLQIDSNNDLLDEVSEETRKYLLCMRDMLDNFQTDLLRDIKNLIQANEIHKRTFSGYKNLFSGKTVVLVDQDQLSTISNQLKMQYM